MLKKRGHFHYLSIVLYRTPSEALIMVCWKACRNKIERVGLFINIFSEKKDIIFIENTKIDVSRPH